MKKIGFIILYILLTVSLSCCSENTIKNTSETPPSPSASAEPTQKIAPEPIEQQPSSPLEVLPEPTQNYTLQPTPQLTPEPTPLSTPEPINFMKSEWLMLGEGSVMLTEEEMNWFNTEFFNKGSNIHNQFLTSTYNCPEDINLNELFYNGTWNGATQDNDIITAQEISAYIAQYGYWIPELDINKLTTIDMDKMLIENMGLNLDETNKVCLTYNYLPEFDAYYHTHGDTNYKEYDFIYGYREKEQINLFYYDSKLIWKSAEEVMNVDSVYRVVLHDTGKSYLFKSNTQLVQAGNEVQYVAYEYTKLVSKQNIEIKKIDLAHDAALSTDSFEEAVTNIESQGPVGSYTRVELDNYLQNIRLKYGELVCGEIGGRPHGINTQLCFVYYDGTVYDLPLPSADSWYNTVSYGSGDGQFSIASVSDKLLVYYVYFSSKMVFQVDTTEREHLIHDAGTYTFYFIPATKECYLTIRK